MLLACQYYSGVLAPLLSAKSSAVLNLFSNPSGYSCPSPVSTCNFPFKPLSTTNAYNFSIFGKKGSLSPTIIDPRSPRQPLASTMERQASPGRGLPVAGSRPGMIERQGAAP